MKSKQIYENDLEDILLRLQYYKNDISNKSIFCVGCTGFIGRWLLDALHAANIVYKYNVKLIILVRSIEEILIRIPEWKNWHEIIFVEGDFANIPETAIPKFDFAIHGVTLHDDGSKIWPSRLCTTLFHGTEILMKLAYEKGCKRVIYLSSGAVYRCPSLDKDSNFTEEDNTLQERLKQPSLYGESKRFFELMLMAFGQQYRIDVVIARCFTFCGRYLSMNRNNALPSIIFDVLNNSDIIIKGDGLTQRSFLYGIDMVIYIFAVLFRGINGVAYNIGSSNGITIFNLAKEILSITNKKCNIKVLYHRNYGNAPSYYVPNTRKIQNTLNVHETVDIKEALYRTIIWAESSFRNNPQK